MLTQDNRNGIIKLKLELQRNLMGHIIKRGDTDSRLDRLRRADSVQCGVNTASRFANTMQDFAPDEIAEGNVATGDD